MDPYIESQGLWRDFHARFTTYGCDLLNEGLPRTYTATLEEAFRLVELPDESVRQRRADVAILAPGDAVSEGSGQAATATATLTLDAETIPLPTVRTEVRDVWIEIRQQPSQRLVTVIEILSPTNKSPGAGYYEYQAKRRELHRQIEVHVVEIDLLLGGQRLPMGRALPAGDYYAVVSRAVRRPLAEVYAWSIRRVLPSIPIPLLPPDPDVGLDLAGVFGVAYERGRYARQLDYAAPLGVPLAAADRAWAEALARGSLTV
jgi:hypothetical protein